MNPTENLEAKLRGFRPRRPSPSIRHALFGPDPTPAPTTTSRTLPGMLPSFWLAPLAASGLLLLAVATPWSASGPLADHPVSMAAFVASNRSGAHPIERNVPPVPSFRSTNDGGIAAHFGSLLIRQTNVFAR